MSLLEIMKNNKKRIAGAGNLRKEVILLISNITLEPYFSEILVDTFLSNNVYPAIVKAGYEDFSFNERKEDLQKAGTIIVWLDFHSLYPDLPPDIMRKEKQVKDTVEELTAIWKRFIYRLHDISGARIIWFGFEDYSMRPYIFLGNIISKYNIIEKLNQGLLDEFSGKITFIDLNRLIATVGINNAFDNKQKYRWGNLYSQVLIKEAANEICKQYLVEHGITKKCIVLDCDNVLWGGILSEDGIENLQLGSTGTGLIYKDFQRFLLQMYYSGVILAICSKNDLDDVLEVFRTHTEMLLKEEHISCFQVNWDNKYGNIKKIAETLNIGLDSIVFIDDSIFEIELVNSTLPDVVTILFEKDFAYSKLGCFNLSENVDSQSINIRNETYRSNRERQQLRAKYQTYDEYLENLNTTVVIGEADALSLNRISELSQRTNRCTNGVRYTVNELKKSADNGMVIYSVHVSDKFGDLGLVGAIGIHDNILKLFCLSCRALGRNVEDQMIQYIIDRHKIVDIDFCSTFKNDDLKSLLNKLPRPGPRMYSKQ
jgi:FkbH-like protein